MPEPRRLASADPIGAWLRPRSSLPPLSGSLACLTRCDPTLESAQNLAQLSVPDDPSGTCQREPGSLALVSFRPVHQLRLDLECKRFNPHGSDEPEDRAARLTISPDRVRHDAAGHAGLFEGFPSRGLRRVQTTPDLALGQNPAPACSRRDEQDRDASGRLDAVGDCGRLEGHGSRKSSGIDAAYSTMQPAAPPL